MCSGLHRAKSTKCGVRSAECGVRSLFTTLQQLICKHSDLSFHFDVIVRLEYQNKFLVMEVANSYVGKSREKKPKVGKAMNTHANIITSHKATYTDNVRVINSIDCCQ